MQDCQSGGKPLPCSQEDKKLANDKSRNLQELFLNNVRKSHASVTVFLVNGVKLQGVITWFDNFSILLKRDQHVQLVYKHAISTIMPMAPVQLQELDDEAEGAGDD